MKLLRKQLAFLMSMALVVSLMSTGEAEAAKKPALSKTKLSINVGKSKKITVKNAKKKAKVTWKTSKKSIAKITKKKTKGKPYAKVKGVKKGKATITAVYKLGKTKKKLKCKVTVKAATSGKTDGAVTTPPNNATAAPSNAATAAPSDGTTAAPSDNASATPSDGATATPSDGTTAAPSDNASATPSDGTTATDTPVITPAPTDLDLSGTVALNGEVTVEEDGSVSSTDCDGLVIPLGTVFTEGAKLMFTVYGEASQGIRGWLESGTVDNGKVSEEINPVEFGKEFLLTATGDGGKYLEIKKPAWNSPAFTSIKITKVTLSVLPKEVDEPGWVTTWGTTEEKNNLIGATDSAMPKLALKDSTIRQIIKVTTRGEKIRFRLSNQFGESDVTVKSMHIAKQVTATKSTIDTSTDTAITVGQKEEFVIPKGQVIVTDPVDFDVAALENVAISMYFGESPTTNITGHRGARATTYQVSGNNVSTETFASPQTTTSWFFLADCSLWTPEGGKAVVCFGDSITDGFGTDNYYGATPDRYVRWGDYFAKRLQENDKTKNVSVINEGLGSNGILNAYPTISGRDRFSRDLLTHDGVAYCIILFGVNDLGKLSNTNKYNEMLPEYQKMVKLCHDNGIKVYGAPILPFGKSTDYYSEASEEVRQMINSWMRSEESGMDGIIDFESALADPADPTCLRESYTYDGLHPSKGDGYKTMAEAIDLSLFY